MTTTNSNICIRQKRNSKMGPMVRKQYDQVWKRMEARYKKLPKVRKGQR